MNEIILYVKERSIINIFTIIDGRKGRREVSARTLRSALNKTYGYKWEVLKSFNPKYINVVKPSKYGGYDWLASVPVGQEPSGLNDIL